MALFGRDSLIASWMTLPVEPGVAEGTLRTLARQQGTAVVPETDEEPGKILHELRFRLEGPAMNSEASAYFGSIDSTPLFVMLLGEARRWGLDRAIVRELLPHADRAIAWIEEYGDRDGDGFVEYERLTDEGFPNQGWKDSPDGVNFASGELAKLPIALCEVQGYVYAAYAARYRIAEELGDKATAARCAERAVALRRAFNAAFWMPERGYFAIGLDGDKRQIDSLTSNIGHLLWTGIVDEDKARAVAGHLVGPDLFGGFGIRTLAASMGAYNPMSYHNGSVWPHDTAIAVAGLMRYGFVDEAQTVLAGMRAALDSFHGRLPELYSGFSREEFAEPVAHSVGVRPAGVGVGRACSACLRSILRLDPVVGRRRRPSRPALPIVDRPPRRRSRPTRRRPDRDRDRAWRGRPSPVSPRRSRSGATRRRSTGDFPTDRSAAARRRTGSTDRSPLPRRERCDLCVEPLAQVRRGDHRRRRFPIGDDRAPVEEEEAVGVLTGEDEVVHRGEHGHRPLAAELVDELEDLLLVAEVESGRRLVEEEERRLLAERPREHRPLRLASRE